MKRRRNTFFSLETLIPILCNEATPAWAMKRYMAAYINRQGGDSRDIALELRACGAFVYMHGLAPVASIIFFCKVSAHKKKLTPHAPASPNAPPFCLGPPPPPPLREAKAFNVRSTSVNRVYFIPCVCPRLPNTPQNVNWGRGLYVPPR